MNAKHTPGPLFVRQPESFPFDIQIVDAKGEVAFRESRYAYSTKQETVEDVMQGHGFPFDQRDAVIAENGRQLADMHLRAAAPDLLSVVANFEVSGPDGDGLVWLFLHGNGTTGKAMFNLGKADTVAAQVALHLEADRRAAIAKATGEPQ